MRLGGDPFIPPIFWGLIYRYMRSYLYAPVRHLNAVVNLSQQLGSLFEK